MDWVERRERTLAWLARGWLDVRESVRPDLVNLLRMTVAAVLAYVITRAATVGPIDLTCSLTAILVTQASATGSAKMALVRVGAVLTGVTVAMVVSIWVGLSWWSLALVVFASLLLASALRLGAQALETPISAMLILGASLQNTAAETRILTTFIGAAVGLTLPLLWPPAIPVGSATSSVRRVARQLGDLFRGASTWIEESPVTREMAAELLTQARDITADIGRASEQVTTVREMSRWNTRAVGRADVTPLLRTGLESLQDCAGATRALFITIGRTAPEREDPAPFSDEVRAAFAVVLHDVGQCIDSFGQLVEAETTGRQDAVVRLLDESTELLRETRAILTDLMLAESDDTDQWLLRGSILRAVGEILAVLDTQERVSRYARWRTAQGSRPLPGREVSRQFVPPLDRRLLGALGIRWHRDRTTGQRNGPQR